MSYHSGCDAGRGWLSRPVTVRSAVNWQLLGLRRFEIWLRKMKAAARATTRARGIRIEGPSSLVIDFYQVKVQTLFC